MSHEKKLREEGYRPSTQDPGKWINPSNGHTVKQHDGGSITVNTSRHNTYGAGMSDTALSERLKK